MLRISARGVGSTLNGREHSKFNPRIINSQRILIWIDVKEPYSYPGNSLFWTRGFLRAFHLSPLACFETTPDLQFVEAVKQN